jgi:signal transduction histidine kinase
MDLSRLVSQISKTNSDISSPWQEKITGMAKLLDTALASVRRISTSLRPEVLDHFGIIYCRYGMAGTGISVSYGHTMQIHFDFRECRFRSRPLYRIIPHSPRNPDERRTPRTSHEGHYQITEDDQGPRAQSDR